MLIPIILLTGIAVIAVGAGMLRRRSRGYVVVTAKHLFYRDKRKITVPLGSIVAIEAVSVDLTTHESWGLQLQTSSATHYLDEDLKGFEKAAYQLGAHFGFDAKEAIGSANASLIKRPFNSFRHTVWTASAN
ncbi:hypothetical protein [Glycocaulis alkaliphilus]|uniref:hypothetical protein n=1 Tax=Glycocaulis alkaliphilus TaxID=1434191 RepID=UPI00166B19CD|nr:hypothetical protein [Glycocaulis alkaliphilus]